MKITEAINNKKYFSDFINPNLDDDIFFEELCKNFKGFVNKNLLEEWLPNELNCKKLDCSGCWKLDVLPKLPHCHELICCNTNIKYIPNLPKGKKLVCYNCPNLETIYEVPNCELLNCHSCLNLKHLPNKILNCYKFTAYNCPNLQKIPTLPTYLGNYVRLPYDY